MRAIIEKCTACGTVSAPPSKSFAHRELICAALASGESCVRGVAYSEDILATLDCIESLGAKYEKNGSNITVHGCGGRISTDARCFCRESGSTLRFLIPIALLSGGSTTFVGTERLIERGVGIYKELFAERGITFKTEKNEHKITGSLAAGRYSVRGNISSQFISGMMFALPLLSEDSILEVIPPVESRSYIDITVSVLDQFGVTVEEREENVFYIRGGQSYSTADIVVEGDWSNAAFLYALGAIGGDVSVENLKESSIQGDRVALHLLDVLDGVGAEIDLSDCPDLAPVLFAVSAAKHGAKFKGTARLRIKESDRAEAMKTELEKFGVRVSVDENMVEIEDDLLRTPREALFGHGDHRIVMALSVLSTLTGGTIEGAEAVKKSFPDFFDVIKTLGVEVSFETE